MSYSFTKCCSKVTVNVVGTSRSSCLLSYLYLGTSYPTPNAQCWSLNVTMRSIWVFSRKWPIVAVQKHVIRVKHFLNSRAYLTTNSPMPEWNIRNQPCEATTQISWARNVEECFGFWCRNGDQEFGNRKLLVQKFLSLWDGQTVIIKNTPQAIFRNLRKLSRVAINFPESKIHGASMGPAGADRTEVGPMLAA